jgi:hypothetical protein
MPSSRKSDDQVREFFAPPSLPDNLQRGYPGVAATVEMLT